MGHCLSCAGRSARGSGLFVWLSVGPLPLTRCLALFSASVVGLWIDHVQSSVHDFSAQPSLEQADPEIYDLLQHEQTRQFKGLELIASEVRAQTHAPPMRA